MVKRILDYLNSSIRAKLLLIIIIILFLADIVIRIFYTRLTGEQFSNWVSPVISMVGFGLLFLTLKQMQKDSRRELSKEEKNNTFLSIKEYLQTNIKFKIQSNKNIAIKADFTKLNFIEQYMRFKGNIASDNDYQILLKQMKDNETLNPDNIEKFRNHINNIDAFHIELLHYYRGLHLKIISIHKSDLSNLDKIFIYEYLKDKLLDYRMLCRVDDFEYIRKRNSTFVVENFKSKDLMAVYHLIEIIPESKP